MTRSLKSHKMKQDKEHQLLEENQYERAGPFILFYFHWNYIPLI